MFTEDGRPSDADPRENGPHLGDERATFAEGLRHVRLTLELKCADLDAEQMARRAVPPSTMSLLGIVRHLAEMEQNLFRKMLAGESVQALYCTPDDRDADFDGAVADPAVVEQAWADWRAEVDFAERWLDGVTDLGMVIGDPDNTKGSSGGDISLRELLVGMFGEYARHLGHVDLLRECIDGRLGQ
ncbi:DUF664 domain-containing protein [Nakamurella sp. YIM 132087]|uniref:DUF664 domain-containing protein n=2 Tax=Nakamurella alba TaxID=2665158 RepID=A0A7K1FKQ6_9ACTN|nr:DUF664 domain-containing protein [Nakamurella alba]